MIEVLIVEDDQRIAEIHRRFTTKLEGFQVVATANTGEEAKEWLEVMRPQLVLLDVYLPDMNGTELVKFIRKNFEDIDIIMITAAPEVNIVRQAMRGGVFNYILKPLTFERFKNSLEKYRLYSEQFQQNHQLSPEQIESIWNSDKKLDLEDYTSEPNPKGIDPLTLNKVLKNIEIIDEEGITAGTFSKEAGISPSTARRYLEHLVAQKQIYAELKYGNVGRPERKYFRKPL